MADYSSPCSTCNPEGSESYEYYVEHYVDKTADDKEVKRFFRVSQSSEYSGAHVVYCIEHASDEIYPHVDFRESDNILRGSDELKDWAGKEYADQHDRNAADECDQNSGMYSLIGVLIVLRTVILAYNYGGSATESGEESDQQIDCSSGSASHCCESCRAKVLSYYDRINSVIKLLEECSEKDREEE